MNVFALTLMKSEILFELTNIDSVEIFDDICGQFLNIIENIRYQERETVTKWIPNGPGIIKSQAHRTVQYYLNKIAELAQTIVQKNGSTLDFFRQNPEKNSLMFTIVKLA